MDLFEVTLYCSASTMEDKNVISIFAVTLGDTCSELRERERDSFMVLCIDPE